MPRKPKFKPIITRVKLNPEQAVLACACITTNMRRTDFATAYFDGWMHMCQEFGDYKAPLYKCRGVSTVKACNKSGSLYEFGALSS
ncbi:hypothetical protein ACFL2I_04570 [Candidatus Omnitrophota bacterium]